MPLGSHAEFALTIQPGHDQTLEPVYLVTQDVQRLKAVLAECKRLRDISSKSILTLEYPIHTDQLFDMSY